MQAGILRDAVLLDGASPATGLTHATGVFSMRCTAAVVGDGERPTRIGAGKGLSAAYTRRPASRMASESLILNGVAIGG